MTLKKILGITIGKELMPNYPQPNTTTFNVTMLISQSFNIDCRMLNAIRLTVVC
jgi:hypothetical protein